MSKPVNITSREQFRIILASSKIVVAEFHTESSPPCKQIAPIYEQLSAQLSQPNKVTFTRIDAVQQNDIARTYDVKPVRVPTCIVFKSGQPIETIEGANPAKLNELLPKIVQEAKVSSSSDDASGAGSGESPWLGASLPRAYADVTGQIDVRGLELLNADADKGSVRTLFDATQPSALAARGKGKGKDREAGEGGKGDGRDYVESDTDEQLMLYVPFQSKLKVHSLHITSVLPSEEETEGNTESPMRPKTIRLYTNKINNMSFDEAESVTATQEFVLSEKDWDAETATATAELKFVKFQNVTSLVVFVVDGDGDGEKTRVDRLRIIGQAGEKRELGKLEKVVD